MFRGRDVCGNSGNSGNPRFWRSRKLGFFPAILHVVFNRFAKIFAFRLGFLNISGFPTQVASGGFFPEKQQPPKCGHAGLVKFGQILTKNDPKCSGAAMFVVISAGPQKVASRLDGKQNFASRADGRLGFEGKVPKVQEGCLRHPSRPAAAASE